MRAMRFRLPRRGKTWTPSVNMSGVEKQYGLIELRTGKKLTVNDVFNNDSDSGGEQDSKLSKKFGQKDEKGVKRQTKLEMQRALQQDPTVYKYDEIYDEMTQKKQELEQTKVNPEKKPKYIQNLMKTAERRKKENERRLERQIQKEREAEGDIYKDKEEFITSSYKQKLEEFKKAEEEEKKMEYIESVMDVSKQQDLGGFYRHLYKETVPDQNPGDKKPEEEEESVKKKEKTPNADPEDKLIEPKQHERNYRKRQHSESPNKSENKEKDSSSSSSDSDSSTDSSSSSSSSDDEKSETKETEVKQNESKSGPEDGEIVELDRKKLDKSKLLSKPIKVENKTGSNDEKLRNGSRNFKQDDRDRRDRNFRSSGYDRGRSRNISRRDDRNYRDQDRERDRDRERERERERRDDRKMHDKVDRKSNDSRRRRSKTPDRRRKSRERSSERTKLRRGSERVKDIKAVKLDNTSVSISNLNDNNDGYGNDDDDDDDDGGGGNDGDCDDGVKKKKVKELKKEEVKANEKNETKMEEVEVKIKIWEKRTVGVVFEAAVERYKLRKASRSS